MDKQTYLQIDRLEMKLDILLRKLAPEAIDEPEPTKGEKNAKT